MDTVNNRSTDPTVAIHLRDIWVSFSIGLGVLSVTLFLFATAVRLRLTHVAPRCEARPRQVIYNSHCDSRQDRGSPFLLGWVCWVMSLSYHQMLQGVPGTGTRKGGLEGSMLRVNLDNIVLLRFHALCLRIALFAMLVYCGFVWPIYISARCFDNPFSSEGLADVCVDNSTYNLTDYEQLTLSNIPPLKDAVVWDSTNVTLRLYAVVLAAALVGWFTCYELQQEWIDVLAMRRVYYLEYDHWKRRREETRQTMHNVDKEKRHSSMSQHYRDCGNPYLHTREAWIPHPEQRDTPPNIGLYSVLVAGLPNRPVHAIAEEDMDEALKVDDDNDKVDWQLAVTAGFFDYAVPNTPGFSSSVAAVSILPSTQQIKVAWQKFYKATNRLTRLRFIRRQLAKREAEENQDEYLASASPPHSDNGRPQSLVSPTPSADYDVYLHSNRRRTYQNEMLGSMTDDEDVDELFLESMRLGPEQTAVYAKEFARGAAGCCPHGCCEERVYCYSTQQLRQMEEKAITEALAAYSELRDAREAAALAQETKADLRSQNPSKHPSKNEVSAESTTPKAMENRLFDKGHTTVNESYDKNTRAHISARGLFSRVRSHKSALKSSAQNGEHDIEKAGEEQQQIGDKDAATDTGMTGNPGPPPSVITSCLPEENRPFSSPVIFRPRSLTNSNALEKSPEASALLHHHDGKLNPWEHVEALAYESETAFSRTGVPLNDHSVANGVWSLPSRHFCHNLRNKFISMLSWSLSQSGQVADLRARDTTVAVVTFTSRQAAIAARRCLADGRGAGRWRTVNEIPVHPLADAAPCDITDCRGCCRPVTISLNETQKTCRTYWSLFLVIIICVGYTVPITWAAENGYEAAIFFLNLLGFDLNPKAKGSLNAFLNAGLLSTFLAFCPHIFLAIANFGSNASSMLAAEHEATMYYWWFMVLFALIGSSVFKMVENAWLEGSLDLYGNMKVVAATIPTQVSSTWTNWIILKFTIYHPLFYLLQVNTFLYSLFRMRCCVRLARGGGAGPGVPYRWFVESGVVLLSTLTLAPAAPITALFAVLYFVAVSPLLRWLVIFTYKPKFDGGGIRWPILFEMCISCLLAGQILLATMMFLKVAVGPAILTTLLIIPTLIYRRTALNRFLRAFKDAALLQMSLLDGWDPEMPMTPPNREEFRRFLVDSHKAAFIPACMMGKNTDQIMTAEPAVVVPTSAENNLNCFRETANATTTRNNGIDQETEQKTASPQFASIEERQAAFVQQQHQYGALMRRGISNKLHHTLSPTENLHDSSRDNSHFPVLDDIECPKVIVSSIGSIVENSAGERECSFGESSKGK